MNYKELEQEVKRLEEQIKDLKVKLEEKAEKKAYEVEFPEDINHLAYLDEDGYCIPLEDYDYKPKKNIYIRGLAFGTREEAERYDRERILLFKMHKWAEECNGEWTPNWNDCNETKYFIIFDKLYKTFKIDCYARIKPFSKLPYFKSEEIARQFIEEFKEEIKEVLC